MNRINSPRVFLSSQLYALEKWIHTDPKVCLSSYPAGGCPACTSSTRAAWTNGWPPAESVQSVELTSKHSWTPTADEIRHSRDSVALVVRFLLSSTPGSPASPTLPYPTPPPLTSSFPSGSLPNVSRLHVTSPPFWVTLYWAKPGKLTARRGRKGLSLYRSTSLWKQKTH